MGDTFRSWSDAERGRIAETARGFPGLIVMPEAGRGFYTNWWKGGRRGDPGWERFYLDELIPTVEARFPILPGRRNHAIAGLSMGGMGTTFLAEQRPDYFGAAASFSGFVQHQRPEVEAGLRALGGPEYQDIFGPMDAFYATGHNPTRLISNLEHTRLFVAAGDGTPRPGVSSSPSAVAGGGAVEAGLRQQNDELVTAARVAGVDVTYQPQQGVHDWPYWREHLQAAIRWGLFAPVPEDPDRWTYRTVAQTGRMWDLTYAFQAPPGGVVSFTREGGMLRATGAGTATVATDGGCAFTATLPFAQTILSGSCATVTTRRRARLRVSIAPRRVRRGVRTMLRFRVSRAAGRRRVPIPRARVRVGNRAVRTDRRGRARLAYRFVGRAGPRRVRVTARGLRAGTARLRVVG